jgi:3-methyl-2-oxobutanoate hydroxymethyltransferase
VSSSHHLYHVSIGSNLGDRLAHLITAATALRSMGCEVRAAPLYETDPVDCPPGSQAFYNSVLQVRCAMLPHDFLNALRSLEVQAGRPTEREKNSSRPLDLDILTIDTAHVSDPELEIPHPRLTQRRFVLQPFADLSPDLQVNGVRITQLLYALQDDASSVRCVSAKWFPPPAERFSFLKTRKAGGPALTVLTVADYPTARLLDESGIDLLLVGDSLGMVVLGFPDTTHVTMDHMLHHVAAVARGVSRAPIIADLPIHSYDTPGQAVTNARRLISAGADAVKLEGGVSHLAEVHAIIADGIPLVGHIGMLPQSILDEGGKYRKKGKTAESIAALKQDALALDAAGTVAIVLESIVPEVAAEITRMIQAPTIGIGAGTATDGQVLVSHDLLGAYPWFRPPFAQPQADLASEITRAARAFIQEVTAPRVAS